MESDYLYPKVDINSASLEQLDAIPYVSLSTAKEIIEHRRRYGTFKSLQDIGQIKGFNRTKIQRLSKYFKLNT